MAIDREKIAARLYPEIVDRPGTRWSRRVRRGVSRLFRTIFHAFFLTLYISLIVKPFRRFNRWTREHWRGIALFLVMLMVWASVHVYWYNKLIRLEYDVLTSWAQVQVERQRRYHIQRNVVDLVIGYSEHERALMMDLTELRAKRAPDAADPATPLDDLSPDELDALFPQIMLVAEQYPQLRLTENFQQFSDAIVATETRVADRTADYNRFVNIYTTALHQFPGNLFASIWGFDDYDYYQPRPEASEFAPINYRGRALVPAEPPAPPALPEPAAPAPATSEKEAR